MSVELQGRGAGMGRYRGLEIAEIQALFAACEQDPSMRSVRSVLRITREQLDARGSLGSYPYLAGGLSIITLLLAAGYLLGPASLQGQFKLTLIGFATAAAATLYGVWHARHDRRANLAQEREIRRLAADTLATLVAHDFPRKPLEREQVQTLQDLLRREPRPGLEGLL